MGEEALVVKRSDLFEGEYDFDGFRDVDVKNYLDIIAQKFFYSPRGKALENNVSLLQIIPYVWFVNPENKEVFLYRRAENKKDVEAKNFVERRYLGKFAAGVGGHIDRKKEKGSLNPVLSGLERELREEIEMINYPSARVIGFVSKNQNIFDRVHFGVIALAETNEEIKPRSGEGLDDGKFYTIEQVDEIISTKPCEDWTKASWPFVREYLLSLK